MKFNCVKYGCKHCDKAIVCDDSPYYGDDNYGKFKVVPFNDLPEEERIKMTYYMEEHRRRGMEQVLWMIQDDIGENQKKKILNYVQDISNELMKKYEVVKW